MRGWDGNNTHWIVFECDSDGKPIPPTKPIKLTCKERLSGKLYRHE